MKRYNVFFMLFMGIFSLFLSCDNGINSTTIGNNSEGPTFVTAKPDKGFSYGYYFYIPKNVRQNTYLLVEPNNTGTTSDDINVHDQKAQNIISWRRSYADQLGVVLLVPVFPRPRSDWQMYTHALDRDTLQNKTGNLARVDLQLIKMIDDFKEICLSRGINVNEKILLNGFSASGDFVVRFTAVHPELVKAVASGGSGAEMILPISSMEGERLIYPIGIADIQEISGKSFNFKQFISIPQYIYLGDLDDNESVPFNDAYGDEERRIIIKVLGRDMRDRWEKIKSVYNEQGCKEVVFVSYPGVGHTITNTMDKDIIDFFKRKIRQITINSEQITNLLHCSFFYVLCLIT